MDYILFNLSRLVTSIFCFICKREQEELVLDEPVPKLWAQATMSIKKYMANYADK